MHTLVLDADSDGSPIKELLKQAENGGVEVRDSQGKIVAYVLSPLDREAWTYAEAAVEVNQNRSEIEQALGRSGGVTTAELLKRTASANSIKCCRKNAKSESCVSFFGDRWL